MHIATLGRCGSLGLWVALYGLQGRGGAHVGVGVVRGSGRLWWHHRTSLGRVYTLMRVRVRVGSWVALGRSFGVGGVGSGRLSGWLWWGLVGSGGRGRDGSGVVVWVGSLGRVCRD